MKPKETTKIGSAWEIIAIGDDRGYLRDEAPGTAAARAHHGGQASQCSRPIGEVPWSQPTATFAASRNSDPDPATMAKMMGGSNAFPSDPRGGRVGSSLRQPQKVLVAKKLLADPSPSAPSKSCLQIKGDKGKEGFRGW